MHLDNELTKLDILGLHEAYKKRSLSPVDVTEYVFEKINQNRDLNSFITLCEEKATLEAAKAEKKFMSGEYTSILLGVPIGLKDLINLKGVRTTMASGVFQDFIPRKDAVVVSNLKSSGSIIIGKQNLHELAYGTTGDDSFYGPTKNPFHLQKIAGGSSSGSAASVAAGLCWGSVGTDTSGSIRIPASLCGVVGMKPTFGKLNLCGIYPLSYSMDHVGPMTRTVMDNAILFDGLSGILDAEKSLYKRLLKSANYDLSNVRIGIPLTNFYNDLDSEVDTKLKKTIQLFKDLGAQVLEIQLDIPDLDELMAISSAIDQTESYLINQDIIHDKANLLGKETRKRILRGSEYKAYELLAAEKVKKEITEKFMEVFRNIDILLTPTVPFLATDIGVERTSVNGKQYQVRQGLMKFTFLSNYIGLPSLTLPCGKSDSGLPIGAQLIGGWNQEDLIYQIAYTVERAL
ncbi:amidase [Paucisalibacillus sp. EB02]|uniref:amidase n=1 Tax=Paucisalibacillus sp. EB02 TaxID=1347087 RepID=UPI0004B6BF79|nr:amidase [Paucisalibacillus sp. EB02]